MSDSPLRNNSSMSMLRDGFDDHSYFSLLLDTLLRVAEGRPYVALLWTATIITIWVFSSGRVDNPMAKVPLITPKGLWDIGGKKARQRFMTNARAVVESGFKQVRLPFLTPTAGFLGQH